MTKGKEPLKKKNSSKKSTVKNNSSKAKREKKDKLFDFNGIILITIGVLIFLALLSVMFSDPTSLAGSMGVFINRIFIGLLGIGAYALPFVLIYMGVSYIKIDKYLKVTKKSLGILMFIVTTMIFVELIVLPSYYVKGNMASAIINQFKSKSVLHGGIISLVITVPISSLLGKVGSYIVLFALYIISLVLINNITIKELFTFEKVESKKKSRDLKQTNIAIDEAMEYVSADGNTRDNGSSEESKIKIIDFMKMDEEENRFEGKIETSIEQPNKSKENRNNIEDIDIDISFGDGNKIYAYEHPVPELLHKNLSSIGKNSDKKDLLNSANKLQETLESFGVEAKVIQVTKGPSVTRFELQPHVGVKVSKIVNLADDIALNLAASGVRIEAPIPGKAAVGIEVPNKDLSAVFLREVIESEEFTLAKKNLAFALGKDIAGNCVVGDLSKMPHLLIAGATGSGKSVCINTLLISLLYKYTPQEVKLLLIDPKVVELNIYNGIPHLLIPVVTEPKKAAGALNWAVNEMTRRYKLFADNNVRNIEGYNDFVEKGIIEEKLPWIVIIIDELADLMMVCPNDVEEYIGRLAQMARAAGMHLVIATQRPSVDVITGVIKANIPSRISFAVSSQIDSRTILDSSGAEKLLGKGDMLYYPVGESKPLRIQGAFVSEEEVETVVEFIRNGLKELEYKKEIMDEIENSVSKSKGGEDCDELIDEAIKIVLEEGQASTSLLQRRLKIGYNRAARIIDEMEAEGIISGRNGSKPRQVFGRDDTMRQ
ncbi:FtsK/SpoIIIE family DNA translocase [Clostridium sp. UBA7791]|uniref:FtsK/SpoIIIE family DNA translocase n=1 Tax=Clostridium sp. UBA7791 TaxID=1946379 RepID=UPI0032163ACF